MSACIYYRNSTCVSNARCLYKIMERNGKISCRRNGDIGTIEKTSERYKPLEDTK